MCLSGRVKFRGSCKGKHKLSVRLASDGTRCGVGMAEAVTEKQDWYPVVVLNPPGCLVNRRGKPPVNPPRCKLEGVCVSRK